MTMIAENLHRVEMRIVQACAQAGRKAGAVSLLAVSITFGADAVQAAFAAGQRAVGENYMRPGFQAPEGGWGLPSVSINSQPQVTINVDDRAIKDAVKVEVKEEIKEELLQEKDRNRSNANDKPLMGND